jgi:hypothetical protein
MVKILMVQDTKVKEIIKNDIWDTILETLDMGIRFGHGEDAIHIHQSRHLQHSSIPANTNGGGS